jgi:hypothetical protein
MIKIKMWLNKYHPNHKDKSLRLNYVKTTLKLAVVLTGKNAGSPMEITN